MPLLDAYIPEGAVSANAERELLARITDLLLEHEGVDPSSAPAKSPRYRFICRFPTASMTTRVVPG
jgi:hypothetical protein